jgi:hypothetical protein
VHDQTYDFFTPSGGVWGTFLWGIQNWGVDNADRTARLAPLVKWFTAVAVSAYEITFIRTGALEVHYFAASASGSATTWRRHQRERGRSRGVPERLAASPQSDQRDAAPQGGARAGAACSSR